MNTKQLAYPTIQEQQQYWIDKEAQSNNATPETREDLPIEYCREYDGAAEHFARYGELPQLMGSPGALDWIQSDPETFEKRVREMKYGIAMEAIHAKPQIHNNNASYTTDPKPRDIGGNELPDRIEANEYWHERNDFDRGDLRDEGRNPDGSGESINERNR